MPNAFIQDPFEVQRQLVQQALAAGRGGLPQAQAGAGIGALATALNERFNPKSQTQRAKQAQSAFSEAYESGRQAAIDGGETDAQEVEYGGLERAAEALSAMGRPGEAQKVRESIQQRRVAAKLQQAQLAKIQADTADVAARPEDRDADRDLQAAGLGVRAASAEARARADAAETQRKANADRVKAAQDAKKLELDEKKLNAELAAARGKAGTDKAKQDTAQENVLGKRFVAAVTAPRESIMQLERAFDALDSDTGAGTVFATMVALKSIDPESVAREGEVAAVAAAFGLDDRAVGALQALKNGDRLREDAKRDLKKAILQSTKVSFDERDRIIEDFRGNAETRGLNADNVVIRSDDKTLEDFQKRVGAGGGSPPPPAGTASDFLNGLIPDGN